MLTLIIGGIKSGFFLCYAYVGVPGISHKYFVLNENFEQSQKTKKPANI